MHSLCTVSHYITHCIHLIFNSLSFVVFLPYSFCSQLYISAAFLLDLKDKNSLLERIMKVEGIDLCAHILRQALFWNYCWTWGQKTECFIIQAAGKRIKGFYCPCRVFVCRSPVAPLTLKKKKENSQTTYWISVCLWILQAASQIASGCINRRVITCLVIWLLYFFLLLARIFSPSLYQSIVLINNSLVRSLVWISHFALSSRHSPNCDCQRWRMESERIMKKKRSDKWLIFWIESFWVSV